MQFSHVEFELLKLEEQIENVQDFLLHKNDAQSIVANCFGIDLCALKNLSKPKQKQYIQNVVTDIYNKNINFMQQKVTIFQTLWNKNEKAINEEFEKIFGEKFVEEKIHIAYVNLNSVCPRFLSDESFFVDANSDDEFLITTCIHELIHFYWFELFAKVFPKTPKSHFESPYPEWELSEIAVDALVENSKLKNFYKKCRPAYDRFYETREIEIARSLYKNNNLAEFMKKGLEFFKNKLQA